MGTPFAKNMASYRGGEVDEEKTALWYVLVTYTFATEADFGFGNKSVQEKNRVAGLFSTPTTKR